MKKIISVISILILVCVSFIFSACDQDQIEQFLNPGDSLGGGGEATYTPSTSTGTSNEEITSAVGNVSQGLDQVPEGATQIAKESKTIESAGDYYLSGDINYKIAIKSEGVTLYLDNANLSNGKKVIESEKSFTLTLIGNNSVTNTDETENKTAITCDGTLTINGNGTLNVTSLNNGISADAIIVKDATLNVNAKKDGIKAEISAYDDIESAPTFSYDNGYVYLDSATVNVNSANDGIQADTFVNIKNSNITILTNGGAPEKITETSSDNGEGKGIKAGAIDWGANDTDLEVYDYLIYVDGGNISINANDDAIHSNGEIVIKGGTFNIATGDDGIHAESLLTIENGDITVTKCYEGIESAKVEIAGGNVDVTSTDDGINAADGTDSRPGNANNNCHIIISGGTINVNASGDGVDSNGSLLISGGTLFVSGSTGSMNAALDADGSIIVNGGIVFAVGALGMVETPASNSAQNCVSFAQNKTISAGTILTLTSGDNEIISYTVPKSCQSVIISHPQLTNGNSYAIYGGSTNLCTFTVSSTITTVGSSNNIGNPGGRPWGGR